MHVHDRINNKCHKIKKPSPLKYIYILYMCNSRVLIIILSNRLWSVQTFKISQLENKKKKRERFNRTKWRKILGLYQGVDPISGCRLKQEKFNPITLTLSLSRFVLFVVVVVNFLCSFLVFSFCCWFLLNWIDGYFQIEILNGGSAD